jgi:apolipoprotein N-acyltransferase
MVFSPDGSPEVTYSKHHMVPGLEENNQPGTDRIVLRRFAVPVGIEICKDLDFPPLSREYSLDGVGLMLVPAWDFDIDRWLHGRMAVLRGVEGGFSIARTAKRGLLTISDPCGRIVAEKRSDGAHFSTIVAKIPVGHEDTLYARYGDWFPGICFLFLAASVICLIFVRRRIGNKSEIAGPMAVDGFTRSTSAP